MGYVNTMPLPDPMDKVVNVTLWSGDRYLNGVRLPFSAADDLATRWTRGKPRARLSRGAMTVRPRYAYVQDGMRTLKYASSGLVTLLEPSL